MGTKGDAMREHLDVATGEIRRLDTIIEQFLSAIRPTQPQLQRTQIHELLDESLRFLKPETDRAKVTVKLDLRTDMPAMPLDANQIKQAFYNLIRNACQAMPDGGTLTVSGTFTDFEVRISFADTGKGISSDQMGKLVQPFATTRSTGTGLGLLIVRRIIREHGGEIDIKSREGKGTRVSLWLLLVENAPDSLKQVPPPDHHFALACTALCATSCRKRVSSSSMPLSTKELPTTLSPKSTSYHTQAPRYSPKMLA